MDEKEFIKRIKNSFRAKKSHAEILSGFQKRGYRLEYGEELIRRAKRPKRMAIAIAICLVLFFSTTFSVYSLFTDPQKETLENPLTGFSIMKNRVQAKQEPNPEDNNLTTIKTYDEIKITPEFVSFLLNEVGAWKLRKNPITLEDPIINLNIGAEEFHSTMGIKIETKKGLHKNPDIIFHIHRDDFIETIISKNSKEVLSDSISSGRSSVEIVASDAKLFSKGYLSFYESLN